MVVEVALDEDARQGVAGRRVAHRHVSHHLRRLLAAEVELDRLRVARIVQLHVRVWVVLIFSLQRGLQPAHLVLLAVDQHLQKMWGGGKRTF